MAEGGAWRSDVFDNGRDFHHGEKMQASPVPGVPATMYNPTPSSRSGQDAAYMPIISMALRSATILFSAVAFGVIASNSGVGSGLCADGDGDCYKHWRALNSANLAYLLSMDVIVCFYSIVQLVLSVVSACTGSPVLKTPKSPAATITFVCDQGLTYMLMAGCGAGAAMSTSAKKGESGGLSCADGFSILCDKIDASVAMSFFAFFATGLSAAMAYFRLYRIA